MCPGLLWCKFAVTMGQRRTWPSGLAMSGVSRSMAWMLRSCTTTMERGTAGLPSNGWPMRQKSAGRRACCMQTTGPRCDWTCTIYPWMAIIRTLPRCSSSIVACFTVTTVMSLRTPNSALLQGRGRSTMKRTKITWGPPVATHSWPSGSARGSPSSWPQCSSGLQWMGGYCRQQHPRVTNAQFSSASPWGRYTGASAGDTWGPYLRPGPGGYPYTRGVEDKFRDYRPFSSLSHSPRRMQSKQGTVQRESATSALTRRHLRHCHSSGSSGSSSCCSGSSSGVAATTLWPPPLWREGPSSSRLGPSLWCDPLQPS